MTEKKKEAKAKETKTKKVKKEKTPTESTEGSEDIGKKVDYHKIDSKWQNKWAKEKIFEADPNGNRPKFFVNIPYPYVNGAPHIGAGFTFIRGEVYSRFKRMQGFNVLYPQGFHATGEPIVGAVKRLKEGDKSQEDAFKIYGVTDKDLKDFVKHGPEFVAKYWRDRWIEDLTATGFAVDWRRTFITTPITPTYSRFIEWQYNTLREKGYVVEGTHPVVWCPDCQSPTGDHDRLEGVGESPIDYTVIKCKLTSGEILPCATLRPETVFGITNIWVHPDVEYVKADVSGEKWILSECAAKKFSDQLKDVKITEKIRGSELVGKAVTNPATGQQVPVLPAEFCDCEMATGIVMSVPAHAPYDWIALVDLKKDKETLKKYDIEKVVEAIEAITVIGKTENPAKVISDEMGIKSQKDTEKLVKATEQIYKREFHKGVCNDKCGKFAGGKVAEIKDALIQDFTDQGFAEVMWETTAPVVCRCTNTCHIHVLENQWFLKFSDPEWKAKAYECIDKMTFYPEEARQQFKNTVAWLKDKACTRRSGMGTPLPWDPSWIVETLSDSVIYMAYYTIRKTIVENDVKAEQLTDEVFDYIFFGKGDATKLSKDNNIDKNVLEEMKRQFEYFYPYDLRTSGKDLVQNHLTYSIFHHVALWDADKGWPKAYGVNGYVNVGGEKMSKSKGNFIPLIDLVKKHGADLTRINIVASNENMDDADWREESLPTYDSRFRYLFNIISKAKRMKDQEGDKNLKAIDIYMNSRLQETIEATTEAYEKMKYRSATQYALFGLLNDLRWYIERSGTGKLNACNKEVVYDVIESLVKMIAPLTPHVAEEMWIKLGNEEFVSTAAWPKMDKTKFDKDVIQLENSYKKTLEDIKQVQKLAGDASKRLCLYFATAKEFLYFNESKDHLKKIGFKEVSLYKPGDKEVHDPAEKAKRAKYGKPGIFVE